MNKETASRISRVVGKIARENKLLIKTNLPVWDSTGTLTGVALEGPKKMGGIDCIATATFVLNINDQADEEKIRAKAQIAADAIKSEVFISIRPKPKAAKAA